jgi:endonuclease YncB( thermonuclease family)
MAAKIRLAEIECSEKDQPFGNVAKTLTESGIKSHIA